MVIFDDDKGGYVSKAISYPSSHAGHRALAIEEHPRSLYMVGDLTKFDIATKSSSSIHLFAFQKNDTSLDESRVLALPTEQYPCAFSFEKKKGQILLVFFADGSLSAYKFESSWMMLSTVQVVENMSSCDNATFASGYEQAFVLTHESAKLYGIDLEEVYEGKKRVT
jgi:hypothetical protein